ncbi:hypothetical protein AB2N08_11980 [Massilia aurea]|uniref:hypothetical protein n=1 Tax=Massilia aurea TaxID=373040 RepID=UPI003462BEB1
MPVQLSPSRLVRACVLAFAIGGAAPVLAVPLTDLRAEDLLPMAGAVKKTLDLSDNQQILWNKAEAASRALLRDRARRRTALQEWAKTSLASPDVDLRKLDQATETEIATANAEDRQLRALWLDVNDGLDDSQRRHIARLLGEQLMRVVPDGAQGGGAPGGQRDDQNRRGGPGNGRGPGSGVSGMGGMSGPGGASLNFGG